MGFKKFYESVRETFGLENSEKESKKKAIKNLLKKLNRRQDGTSVIELAAVVGG